MKEPHILKIRKASSIPWFEQIEKEILFPGENEPQIYYTIKPPDYVTALARTKESKFIILKQYRPAIEGYTHELPSGHVEKGENPKSAMMRELKEETNCVANEVILLGELIPDTGRLENRLWAFYIDGVEIKHLPKPDKNEGIEVFLVSREKLFQMIREGHLNHALDLSVIALAIFKGYLNLKYK